MKIKLDTKLAIWLAAFYFTFGVFCQGAEAQSEVRFRLVQDTVIVVSVTINDQGPFDFVFDTGTNSTIVDPKLASRLSLSANDHITLISVSREQSVVRSSLRNISMGPATAKDLEVLVQDLSGMRKVDSHIVGIVGQNFLSQFNYLIDYKRRSIRVEQDKELRGAIEGSHSSFELNEGLMLVSAELQSRGTANLRLLLDSGANLLMLYRPASFGLDMSSSENPWTLNTGNEENGSKIARVKTLTVGTEQFHNLTTALPDIAAEPQRAEDGSLPTVFFHTIYINNLERYVVFNAELKANR